MYGRIEYNEFGNPKCEICGKHFMRVLNHVRQKHDMNEREYKKCFGFDLFKGICSKASSQRSRERVYEHYEKVVAENLLISGLSTRYIKNHKGRTKDKISFQTKLNLQNNYKNIALDKMIESGRRVGKSGLGNKKRWGDKSLS
jgi:predicted transcriptional regulator